MSFNNFYNLIKQIAIRPQQSSTAQGQAQVVPEIATAQAQPQYVQQIAQTDPSMVAGAVRPAFQVRNPYQGGGFPAIIQHLIQAGAISRTQAQPQRLDMFRQSNNPSGGGYYG